jgi:hypothetical protein
VTIARLLRNPAAVVLAAIVVGAAIMTVWAVRVVVSDTGQVWNVGQATDEDLAAFRLVQFAHAVPEPATLVGVLALLGVIIIGAVTSRAAPHGADVSEGRAR